MFYFFYFIFYFFCLFPQSNQSKLVVFFLHYIFYLFFKNSNFTFESSNFFGCKIEFFLCFLFDFLENIQFVYIFENNVVLKIVAQIMRRVLIRREFIYILSPLIILKTLIIVFYEWMWLIKICLVFKMYMKQCLFDMMKCCLFFCDPNLDIFYYYFFL